MVVKVNIKLIALVLVSLLVVAPGTYAYYHLFLQSTGLQDDKGNSINRSQLIDLTLSREVQRINAEKNQSTPASVPHE